MEQRRRAEITIAAFSKIKSNDHLDIALELLEEALVQANIPGDRWIMPLKTTLVGKHAELLPSLRLLPDTTFQYVKEHVLQAGDYTVTKAGTQLFNTDRRDLNNLTALELYLHFYRLVKRVQTGAETAEDNLQAWMIAAIRHFHMSRTEAIPGLHGGLQ